MRIVEHPGFTGFSIVILPTGINQATQMATNSIYQNQLSQIVHDFYDEAGLSRPSSVLADLLNHWLTARHKEGDVLHTDAIVDMVGQVSRLQRFLAATYEQSIKIGDIQEAD